MDVDVPEMVTQSSGVALLWTKYPMTSTMKSTPKPELLKRPMSRLNPLPGYGAIPRSIGITVVLERTSPAFQPRMPPTVNVVPPFQARIEPVEKVLTTATVATTYSGYTGGFANTSPVQLPEPATPVPPCTLKL